MSELLLPIAVPNESGFADDADVLRLWEEVHALLSQHSAVFIVSNKPTEWFGVSVDATRVVGFLRAELERRALATGHAESAEAYEDLTLTLHITRSGALPSSANFPTDRFIEQLFLACNLAQPGSCAFKEAWDWLHEDLSYDCEVATTPAQIGIFTLILLASRSPLDPDSIVAVVRAIEAIFARGVRENITKTLEERIERAFGRPDDFPRWFRQFYDQRSRLVHGDKRLLRPGLTHPRSPEALEFMDEHLGPLTHGVRLLMATLFKMIRSGERSLDA